jgi:hypothetical protein
MRGQDYLVGITGLGGEIPRQQVGGALGFRPRQGEVVGEPGAHRT